MNKGKKTKMIVRYNDTECLDTIKMKIRGEDDFPQTEHTLEEFDIVTMYFKNKEEFVKELIKKERIDSEDVDLFIADRYKYNGEHIRTTGLIYKSYLTKYLNDIALDRLAGRKINNNDSSAIIISFNNLIERDLFGDLCVNVQGSPLNNKMREYVSRKDKDAIWSIASKNYRVLRDMVCLINDYYRLLSDNEKKSDIKTKYSSEIIKREKSVSRVSELIGNENYGKQMHLNSLIHQ